VINAPGARFASAAFVTGALDRVANRADFARGASGGGFTRADQCVGAFARSMKHVAFAYDKACEVAKQMATTDTKP
jgi:hypothetical protein